MKKKSVLLFALVVFAVGVVAGPISVSITSSEETYRQVAEQVSKWAGHPTSATACNGGTCCAGPTTTGECRALAQSIVGNLETWTRVLYPCLQQDGDWACNLEFRGSTRIMYCETIPSANVLLGDVASCASEQAGISFPGAT